MIGGREETGQMERENKGGGSREVDQYMDSYGDNITIGCPGKIAYHRLVTFASSWDRAVRVSVCACACVCVGGGCVGFSPDLYKRLSMNESIECARVCNKF